LFGLVAKGSKAAKKCGQGKPAVNMGLVKFLGPEFFVPFQRSICREEREGEGEGERKRESLF
jgi:hypothetical protein